MTNQALTPKQQRFAHEYLVDLNATAAAIRAGYSKKTAKSIGQENLTKPALKKEISRLRAVVLEKIDASAEKVLREVARIAFGNAGDVMDWGPGGVTLVAKSALTPDQIATVSEAAQRFSAEGGSIKLKQYDKLKALELLGKHYKLWGDDSKPASLVGIVVNLVPAPPAVGTR